MIAVLEAQTNKDYAIARDLIVAYQKWLGIDLEFQGFSRELKSLSVMYGPPYGAMLLAKHCDEWIGCVGLRKNAEGVAEMKRMFVLPKYQRLGAGRALTEAFIATARRLGYSLIRLDTSPRLDCAIRLYEKVGFIQISPYRYNPDPDAVYMELKLR